MKLFLKVSILLLAAGAMCRAETTIERINYRGWNDSYRMTAEAHSLVVVPEIGGRIMEYSLDGRNVIWENPEEFGKMHDLAKEWRNYGGYKTWVSPQDAWGWPPDPILDRGKANIETFDTDGRKWLRIIGCPSFETGVAFVKELTLSETGDVTLVQRMRNVTDHKISWGIHDVTQVQTPCFVVFPVRPDSRLEGGFQYLAGDPQKSTQFTVRDGLCITSYHGKTYQISSDSDGPWMVWFKDDLAYVKLFPPMKRDSEYGDRGSSVTVFTSDGKLGYLEMEVLGPITELAPGQETSLTETWRIYRLDYPVKSQYSIPRVIKEMAEKGWIPPAK